MRSEAPRRSGGEFTKLGQEEVRFNKGGSTCKPEGRQASLKHTVDGSSGAGKEPESKVPLLEVYVKKNVTKKRDQDCRAPGGDHEIGKGGCLGQQPKGILPFLGKEKFEGDEAQKASEDVM